MDEIATERFHALLAAAQALADRHELSDVLDQLVVAAAEVADGEYAALAIYDENRTIETFITRGMEPETVTKLGHPPVGRGLLGDLFIGDHPIRLDDLTAHHDFTGFPPHHPPMRTFVGVPVRTTRRSYGNLYVTERRGGRPFDDVDEQLLVVLAAFAAGAIEGATLLADERARLDAEVQLAAAREREAHQTELLDRIITAQEAERARVSRDLHDDVGQALTSVLLGLRLVEDALATDPARVADAVDRAAEVRTLVTEALQTTRTLAFELRPTVLDDLGLAAALHRLVEDTRLRHGIDVDIDIDGIEDLERLPAVTETVVYRVVQEALTNVVRHAHARGASVTVTRLDENTVRAVIEDDGRGFDAAAERSSLGLRGMAERASLAGGSIMIEASPGSGTTVRLEVPGG